MNPYAEYTAGTGRNMMSAMATGRMQGGNQGARSDSGTRTMSDGSVLSSHAIAIIKRLEICLDEESVALSSNSGADLTPFITRKSQGLMEFNRIVASFGDAKCDERLNTAILLLRAKIERNMGILRVHLAAVGEISELLADAIRTAESDGTYSPAIRGLK
jgi:hypothetical protein